MADIADAEAAFIAWLEPALADFGDGTVHADNDTDSDFARAYRSGGPTDPGTLLDHPQMVVSIFGATPPAETSKHAVATTALDALARALDMKGNTVAGCVVTDVTTVSGLQLLPEPTGRWHYQFTVQLTTHPERT